MRKIGYFIILLVVTIAAFLAGGFHNKKSTIKNQTVRQPPQEETAITQDEETDPSSLPPGTVRINSRKQQIIGIQVGQVEKKSFTHTIRFLGKVAPDETRIYFINATVDGWVTQTRPNTTGSLVKKNETLASFYSPEFLSAGQALLFALSSRDRIQTTGKETAAQKDQLTQFNINLQQYRDSLRNLGMGDLQIDEMIQRRRYMENVNITSPANGFILSRKVSPGLRFEKGWEFYRIADLSRVWILADVYGNEVNYFKPGTEARAILPDQKKVYRARVSKVLPVFEPSTRTLKVRLETDNPGFTLRPDMFVDVEFPVNTPPAMTVPADAVLNTGLKKTVFVDLGNGYFEPREVQTGWHLGNRIEITKGLSPGERIVTSGTFLIDSESRMELAAAGMTGSLSKDPVSGVEVSVRKAEKTGRKSSFQGKTYYFATEENRTRFNQDPGRYAGKTFARSPPAAVYPPHRIVQKGKTANHD